MGKPLDDQALAAALADLPGWTGDTNALLRTAALPTFPSAIAVVDKVAIVAEELDHHPDIDIRWRTITFRCSTHSAGGVTALDVTLAGEIDGVLELLGQPSE